jgi:hypothetical protein
MQEESRTSGKASVGSLSINGDAVVMGSASGADNVVVSLLAVIKARGGAFPPASTLAAANPWSKNPERPKLSAQTFRSLILAAVSMCCRNSRCLSAWFESNEI